MWRVPDPPPPPPAALPPPPPPPSRRSRMFRICRDRRHQHWQKALAEIVGMRRRCSTLANHGSMLSQSRRRWPNIDPGLGQICGLRPELPSADTSSQLRRRSVGVGPHPSMNIPANTARWTNAGLMLVQRRTSVADGGPAPLHCGLSTYAPPWMIYQDINRWENTQRKRGIDQMLFWCWADVEDSGPTLKQHWVNASCLLGWMSALTSHKGAAWDHLWIQAGNHGCCVVMARPALKQPRLAAGPSPTSELWRCLT